jgi:hypothetical protein
MQLLDSSLWTAKEAQDILNALDALSSSKDGGIKESCFFVTDLLPAYKEQIRVFSDMHDINLQVISVENNR